VAEGRGGKWLDDQVLLITAAVTGLLFGLHPVHVESVAWVSERKDLLCALFYLLSIMMYVTLRQAQGNNVLSVTSGQALSNHQAKMSSGPSVNSGRLCRISS
jgi:hypothetical protein